MKRPSERPAPPQRLGMVRPVYLRMGSPSAPAERSFAFSLSGEDLLLAGPASLLPGQLVYLDIEDGSIRAQCRVWNETPGGHKAVQVDYVWAAEEGAFERWRAGAVAG